MGRRKFLRPLYQEMAKTPEGLEWARRIYAQARPTYHPVAVNTIDQVLEWEEAEEGGLELGDLEHDLARRAAGLEPRVGRRHLLERVDRSTTARSLPVAKSGSAKAANSATSRAFSSRGRGRSTEPTTVRRRVRMRSRSTSARRPASSPTSTSRPRGRRQPRASEVWRPPTRSITRSTPAPPIRPAPLRAGRRPSWQRPSAPSGRSASRRSRSRAGRQHPRPERLGHHHRHGAHAAGRAGDQHRLAGAQAALGHQVRPGGERGLGHRGALLEAQPVGQPHQLAGRRHRALGLPASGEERHHPVAGPEARVRLRAASRTTPAHSRPGTSLSPGGGG